MLHELPSVKNVHQRKVRQRIGSGISDLSSAFKKYRSGKFMTIMNLSNSLIGGAIMTFPATMYQGGVGASILFVALTATICSYTCCLLVSCSSFLNLYTYQDIVNKVFGTPGRVTIVICQFFYPILVTIMFSILVTDNIVEVAAHYFPGSFVSESRPILLLLFMIFIFAPLSFFRNISFLDKFSVISLILVLEILIFMLVKFPTYSTKTFLHRSAYNYGRIGFSKTCAITSFAFTSHHNVLQVYRNLKNRDPDKFYDVILWSHGIIAVLSISITVFCYATFNVLLTGNMFNFFCCGDHFANVSRILFSITLALTYPFQIFASRQVIIGVCKNLYSKYPCIHYFVTTLLLVISYVIPIFFSDVSFVTEIGGSLTAAPLVYILPAALYMKLFFKSFKPNNFQMVVLWFILIYGVAIVVCSTAFSIFDLFHGHDLNIYRPWCSEYFSGSTLNRP